MSIDSENLKSQYQEYIYPLPVENIDEEIIVKKIIPYADPNFSWHILWPEKTYSRKKMNILVAGCGSDQAAIIAKCNPLHQILGVDISINSIEHQNKLKIKHSINNLKLINDDFRNIKVDEKFDYIISTGVIHHLDNPGTALNFFNENLKEDGVINLMIYGDKKTHSLNQIKKIFTEMSLEQNKKSIDIVKKTINGLNAHHPAKIFSNSINDINYDSGIIDLALHKKEKFYEINELVSMLDQNNLLIKNFFDGRISSLTKFFLYDKKIINYLRNLDINKKLEFGQILNWDDRTIELVLTKKSQIKNSLLYNEINLINMYIYPNRSIDYKINEHNIEVKEKYSGTTYTYNFSKDLCLDWKKIFSGQIKMCDLYKDEKQLDSIKELFKILFENKHIDVSFCKIENYLNFLGR